MSNSSLISCTSLSTNNSGKRTHFVDRITPHCFVGQVSTSRGLEVFKNPVRKASCNYVIGTDGTIGLCVNEDCRSWCTSSNENDQRAITIECASDTTEPYTMNDDVYNTLIELSVDICKRYNKTKLIWINDKDKALSYSPKDDEMLITVHRWFANKSCPGDWLYNKLQEYADTVTKKLQGEVEEVPTESTPVKEDIVVYRVQVGAFKTRSFAEELEQKLKKLGYATILKKDGELYKVQVGAFRNKDNATKYQEKVIADGFNCFITIARG